MVTGATGFIGQRLIPLLIKKYKTSEILCLVWNINTPREIEARKILKKLGVKIELVDLLDKDSLPELPKNPRFVFHLAATTDTALSDHRCNDLGTKNLISSLRMDQSTVFVHIGTSAMYCGRLDCNKPINEQAQPSPSNNYGRTKLLAEKLLIKDSGRRKYSLTILRPPTVYGSNPRDNSLFDFLKKLILKRSPLARLNWPGLTSLVWVDDMARTIVWAAKRHSRPGVTEDFIVSAEALTLSDICRLMHLKLGVTYDEIRLPNWLWRLFAQMRKYVFFLEKFLPSKIYNLPWRATLVIDNVLYCDAIKLAKSYSTWKPSLFKNKLNEVL